MIKLHPSSVVTTRHLVNGAPHFDIFGQFGYYNAAKGEIVWKPGACYQYMSEFFDLAMDPFIAMIRLRACFALARKRFWRFDSQHDHHIQLVRSLWHIQQNQLYNQH
jgi:hypothetical protein